jgi:hypothetical protein
MRVLDVGSGDSMVGAAAQRRGCHVVRLDKQKLSGGSAGKRLPDAIVCDILKADQRGLGTFDRVFLSLVTLYIPPAKLGRLWEALRALTRRNGSVLAVDLHPASKVISAVPWRAYQAGTAHSYWDGGKINSRILSRATPDAKITSYWHHTLAGLTGQAIAHSFRLELVAEFPRKWERTGLRAPAYLLCKWRRH